MVRKSRRKPLTVVYIDIGLYNAFVKSLDPDVQLLQAIADPVRLSIVRQLATAGRPVCACDFIECCTVSQPTISHHLKVLREAGAVTSDRQGTFIYYQLSPDFAARWSGIGSSLSGLVQVM
jgi:ArsR family transcriptional regulator, arsenate/arsenite/antimonite-responsive transcriptional repressor